MSGLGKKSTAEIASEALREAGVLVVVFYGLGVLLPAHPRLGLAEVIGGLAGIVMGLFLWWQGVLYGRMA